MHNHNIRAARVALYTGYVQASKALCVGDRFRHVTEAAGSIPNGYAGLSSISVSTSANNSSQPMMGIPSI